MPNAEQPTLFFRLPEVFSSEGDLIWPVLIGLRLVVDLFVGQWHFRLHIVLEFLPAVYFYWKVVAL